jgi:FAE1/Type III polyketide synthase-like protein
MLIPNCLFRSNGSAVLLSTARRVGAARAKYTLPLIVRTHLAADETAYACVYQTEDADGNLGVRLNKDLMTVGADALRANLARLGPAVLPWSELARYAAVTAARRAVKQGGPLGRTLKAALPARALEPYVPDFGRAFSGFCIHTGECTGLQYWHNHKQGWVT